MKRPTRQPSTAASSTRIRDDRAPAWGSAAKPAGRHRAVGLGLALSLLSLVVLAVGMSASLAATANPVLGAKAFAAPYGKGFGTAEPGEIFNGGDPSGSVTDITWRGWGNPSAIGYGRNPIFKPRGGYHRKPARIELRATALGKCGSRRAYRKLEVRIPKHPGGKLGKWLSWAGAKTICKPPY